MASMYPPDAYQSDDSLWHSSSLTHTPHFNRADSGMQAFAGGLGETTDTVVFGYECAYT
jgi:hypothetical protein